MGKHQSRFGSATAWHGGLGETFISSLDLLLDLLYCKDGEGGALEPSRHLKAVSPRKALMEGEGYCTWCFSTVFSFL